MSKAISAPRVRLTDVVSRLESFVITTFDVDPASLRALLPEGFEVETVTLAGRARGLVSAVTFVNTGFHVRFAPFVRLRAAQVNYRAYIRRGAEHAVWFFGTGFDSAWVALPRLAWGLPWHRARCEARSTWHAEGLGSLEWRAEAEGAAIDLELLGTGQATGVLPGFEDAADTQRLLTDPLTGYVRTTRGTVATYGVWHVPLVLERAQPRRARFELFERSGLVGAGQAPHSVLVQRESDFVVLLPPRRVP